MSVKFRCQCEPYGNRKKKGSSRIRINRERINSQVELSKRIPFTIIHPESVQLISGSPVLRRRYIDWIAFYLFPDYARQWNQYRQALAQRNACLRQQASQQGIEVWTRELCQRFPIIHQYRQQALHQLLTAMKHYQPVLFSDDNVKLLLKSGYPKDQPLDTGALQQFHQARLSSDVRLCRTLNGAHTANLSILFNGKPAAEVASRGQIKMLSLMLILAQSKTSSEQAIIAFDDLSSEFDVSNEGRVLALIDKLQQQVIITSTANQTLSHSFADIAKFHVEQGQFRAL